MVKINQNYQKQNQFKDSDLVCYCFKYKKKDIENDYLKNIRSTIYEKIKLEKSTGRCNCATKNPKGK
jgi:hypothetical protein